MNINIDDEIGENNLCNDDEIKKLKIELDLLKNNKIQIPEQILKTEKIIHTKQKLNEIEFKLDCTTFDIMPYDKKKGNKYFNEETKKKQDLELELFNILNICRNYLTPSAWSYIFCIYSISF